MTTDARRALNVLNRATLEDDLALPERFLNPAFPRTGARRLLLAVLRDAVARAAKYADKRSAPERAWFASRDAESPFAFVNVCGMLGLDVAYIRRGVEELEAAAVERDHARDRALRRGAVAA